MEKAKTVRFEIPKAKLLKFNRKGKSIPTAAPKRDEVAEEFWFLRHDLSDATWAIVRPYAAAELERERAERNGGTAS
jgi:hypothetical protein